MFRKTMSLLLIASGMLIIFGSLGVFAPTRSAYAQSVPQPTPRPALGPEDKGDGTKANTQEMAHITGTLIDQNTGAPVPNVTIRVGDTTVSTDANGNYDLWIEPGDYSVGAVSSDGTPQPTVSVVLIGGQMVVQHLTWVSVVPTAVPTPPITAAVAPQPTVVVKTEGSMPDRLPHTAGNPLFLFGDWFWISLGFALVVGGTIIGTRADAVSASARMLARYAARQPHATPAADAAALLAALLTTEVRASTPRDDALLRALLDRDSQRRRDAQDVLAELL